MRGSRSVRLSGCGTCATRRPPESFVDCRCCRADTLQCSLTPAASSAVGESIGLLDGGLLLWGFPPRLCPLEHHRHAARHRRRVGAWSTCRQLQGGNDGRRCMRAGGLACPHLPASMTLRPKAAAGESPTVRVRGGRPTFRPVLRANGGRRPARSLGGRRPTTRGAHPRAGAAGGAAGRGWRVGGWESHGAWASGWVCPSFSNGARAGVCPWRTPTGRRRGRAHDPADAGAAASAGCDGGDAPPPPPAAAAAAGGCAAHRGAPHLPRRVAVRGVVARPPRRRRGRTRWGQPPMGPHPAADTGRRPHQSRACAPRAPRRPPLPWRGAAPRRRPAPHDPARQKTQQQLLF